jgi:hypothetical protein
MKDRWKILLAALIISLVLAVLFIFLGFSFKVISLREYGLLQYSFFHTVDPNQPVRTSGNYLVGIDHSFITYPKGLLYHKFNVDILTKDKSILSIEGLFVGQLIESEIINLHFSYGPDQFFPIVCKTVEEIFRESI